MKLFGKKKEDPLNEPDPFAQDPAFNPQAADPFSQPTGFDQPQHPFPPMGSPVPEEQSFGRFSAPLTSTPNEQHPGIGGDVQKDLALILAKVDAIKSELDAVNIRLHRIEQTLEQKPEEQKPAKRYANVY